jgi:DNA/RNA-binding domain of Phe-tRNA-synthetase-like protein
MVILKIEDEIVDLVVALVEATDVKISDSSNELRQRCDDVCRAVAEHGLPGGDERRTAVRDLLRTGGFKPAGRNKPAQEYLLRTVKQDGSLPAISNAVELINMISLQAGLPISLVSLDRVGTALSLRFGRPDEAFVFNPAGQELALDGLICLCADAEGESDPVGSPVKDSMKAKVDATDHHLLACIYGSQKAMSLGELRDWAEQLGDGFTRFCGASGYRLALLP